MVTGSHNPPDWNGIKMVRSSGPFHGADIQALGTMAAAGDWERGDGSARIADIMDRYVEAMLADFRGGAFTIAWDCGNGAAGPVVERLTRLLPGTHHLLFSDVDGRFPNHHPDPTVEANLADLKRVVRDQGCDFGVAFDGDADRIGAVDGQGRVVWGDELLGILAEPVLQELPGSTIIGDIKASQALFDRIAALGGVPDMWKSGHSLMKARLLELNAPLAGEMSGHIFFKERWYGFDDGLYAGARLLEILSRSADPCAVLEALPDSISTPELQWELSEGENYTLMEALKKSARFDGAREIITIDGLRVEYPDGFGLARPSNTTPIIVLRFEADSTEALKRIQADFRKALLGVKAGAKLPF
jgi:phosphomannomutase